MDTLHQDGECREQSLLDLDELARQGARRMLAEVLEAEVADYLEAARGQRYENGHALVVRNGHAKGLNEREVVCGAGSVEIKAPRVNDHRVEENGPPEIQERGPAAIHAPLAEGHRGAAFTPPARPSRAGTKSPL